jgi:penicillin-binding protein 2
LHYGAPTGIELVGEAAGVLPTPAWKQKVLGQPWYLGDTYHMGIGQGDVLATPLQINQSTSALVHGGVWCEPHVLAGKAAICDDLRIPAEYLAAINEGMKAACASGGTGFPFFDKQPVEVVCKTGTAEFGEADEKGRRKTHAVFTVAAPADAPKYAVTVLIEGTEEHPFLEGSSDAAPIAKELLKMVFGQ